MNTWQPSNEERLIAQSQRGDVNAFNRLILAYQETAYNVAYRILGNRDLAMDATQEAFLRAFQALGRFRGGSFKAWLLRITTNCCYDLMRHKQRRPTTPIDDLIEDEDHAVLLESNEESMEDHLERRELGEMIQRGIAALPEDQRIVLILSDIEGLDYNEIAQVLRISLGTVKSRLSRARAKMRDYLLSQKELPIESLRLNHGE